MSDRSNIVYLYDGSFDGFLCCVFESYVQKEVPVDIIPIYSEQCLIYKNKEIITDYENAQRVNISLKNKISSEAKYLIETAFLFGGDEKTMAIYDFIKMGYKLGGKVTQMFDNAIVSEIHGMVRSVTHEKEMMLGFVRFSDFNGRLVSVIEPKHYLLPIMEEHFISRYPSEQFLIFDKTHNMALVYGNHRSQIIEIDAIQLPPADETEKWYRKLWTKYYNSVAIKERYNPRCRMTHMPKRFWCNLTEMNTFDEEITSNLTIQLKE